MLKRVELHNHTIESDGTLSAAELIDYMYQSNVDIVSITDHNTISGHNKAVSKVEEDNLNIKVIKGVEFTTYYGHMLCLNLEEYIDWSDINYHNADVLIDRVKSKDALVGIAHPFSDGAPFSKGCKWEMKIHDYNKLDFIEIFNNAQDLHRVNKKAIKMWEDLIIDGYKIAPTTGMDIHKKCDMTNKYHTYINTRDNEYASESLDRAIKNRDIFISRSDVLTASVRKKDKEYMLEYDFIKINKSETIEDKKDIIINIKGKNFDFITEYSGDQTICLNELNLQQGDCLIVKSYYKNNNLENLLSIAPVIYID